MGIKITCKCGKEYELKDEFAGRIVQCPNCLENSQLPEVKFVDPIFNRDKFLLRQKMAISEKYCVWNEQEQPLLFIERPAYMMRNVLALFGAIGAAIITAIVFGSIAVAVKPDVLKLLFGFCAFLGAIAAAVSVAILLAPKRHITFYRDESKGEKILTILQDKKFQMLEATYTVNDNSEKTLCFFRKNYIYDIFRKKWECCRPDGTTLCTAQEDSLILSLLRRYLGPLFGLLRINFIIFSQTRDDILGEFNRKMTILDRYVLDLSKDAGKTLDRRIALALGVMLDTGERR